MRAARVTVWMSALAIGILCTVFGSGLAAATRGPTIEITTIHASRSDGGGSIDPLLGDLPQLTREQPFVRYNVYKVLERKELPLERGKIATSDLPNGRGLHVTLVDELQGAHGPRYHVRAEIAEPGAEPSGKAFLKLLEVTASANEPFFVGGQSYRGGTLFLELIVRP